MDDIKGRILQNENIVSNYYLLRVKLSKSMGKVEQGQFVMLKVPSSEVFLRRPFSIYEYNKNILTIMYRVVGRGTEYLSKACINEEIFILGPLGKGFKIGKRGVYIIVAGGIGIAGLRSLAKRLKEKALIFYGCSSEGEIALLRDIGVRNVNISTIDGSYGSKGDVVALLGKYLKLVRGKNIEIFACGPENMIRSLKKLIDKDKTPCQVLVEERMACGLGLCFGCVKRTFDKKEPYKRVCKEGPVFNLWEICL
jgi:dihydroorotate dehydrogenase electron transfer subunit